MVLKASKTFLKSWRTPGIIVVFNLKTAIIAVALRRIAFNHKEIRCLANAKFKVLKVAVTTASASQGTCHIYPVNAQVGMREEAMIVPTS